MLKYNESSILTNINNKVVTLITVYCMLKAPLGLSRRLAGRMDVDANSPLPLLSSQLCKERGSGRELGEIVAFACAAGGLASLRRSVNTLKGSIEIRTYSMETTWNSIKSNTDNDIWIYNNNSIY